MKKQLIIYLFFISSFSGTTLSMEELSQPLAPHNPELAKVHEQSLRGFKRSNTLDIQIQQAAIAYFETTDHPNREFMLCQCEAAKYIISHYVPKIQSKFTTLLAQERAQPDSARWQKIKKVLPVDTTIDLHPDEQLIQKLIALAHDPEQSHEKWCAIIKPSEPQVEEAPPFPALPPLLINHDSQEDQSSDQDEEEEDEEEESDHDEVRQNDNANGRQAKQPALQKKAPKPGRVFIPTKKKNKNKGKQSKGKKKKPAQLKQAQQKTGVTKRFWDALTERNPDALKRLLTKHKSVLDANMRHAKLDKPALHLAVMLEDTALCTVLLEHGARPRETSLLNVPFFTHPLRVSALALAVHSRSTEIVDLLLNKGADPNQPIMCQNVEAEHILCLASTESHLDPKYTPEVQERMIKRLLLGGAKAPCKSIVLVDLKLNRSWPIDLEKETHQEGIALIVECTKEIKCVDNTIVLFADSQGITDILEDPEDNKKKQVPTELATHLLWHALEKKDENKACALLENIQDPTLLTTASEYCHLGMLHYCVINNLKSLCLLLLDRGADPNGVVEVTIKSDDGQSQEILQVTPLTFAILNGYVDLAVLLYARGADFNKQLEHKPNGKEYPLCCAIASLESTNPEVLLSSRKQIIKFLLLNGATKCTRNILVHNTHTNSETLLDPSDADDLTTIHLLLEEDNIEECMEYKEGALILKTSFDACESDEIGQYIFDSSNDQEQSE